MYSITSSCICLVGQYGRDCLDICWSSFIPPAILHGLSQNWVIGYMGPFKVIPERTGINLQMARSPARLIPLLQLSPYRPNLSIKSLPFDSNCNNRERSKMEGEEAVGLVRLARSAPLSDGRWWMCSVGIGVSHLKEQKQMVWLEVHRFFRSAVIGW